MLIAMTYQAELFLMVVFGLALGHLFSRPSPPQQSMVPSGADKAGEKLEPCCDVERM